MRLCRSELDLSDFKSSRSPGINLSTTCLNTALNQLSLLQDWLRENAFFNTSGSLVMLFIAINVTLNILQRYFVEIFCIESRHAIPRIKSDLFVFTYSPIFQKISRLNRSSKLIVSFFFLIPNWQMSITLIVKQHYIIVFLLWYFLIHFSL